MESHTSRRFREALARLPKTVQKDASDAFRLFRDNPRHPSLQFKKVHATKPIYSARVSGDYRAIGTIEGDCVVWFWVGPHAEYSAILSRL